MEESMSESTAKTKELVLGFDAGCGKCSEIARHMEDRVGTHLSVRSLHDPDLAHWREEALGENAPWVPTLFEVEDGVAQVWIGRRMALPLSRKLGLTKTWQLMQVLGDLSGNANADRLGNMDRPPLSRGQFLKGVGGAAVALSVLSGTGALTSAAQAAERSPHDIVKITNVTGASANQIAQRARLNADTRMVLRGNVGMLGDKRRVYRHTLRDGRIVNGTMFFLASGAVLTSAVISNSIGNRASSVSKLWKPAAEGSKKKVIVRASEGGKLWLKQSSERANISGKGCTPLEDCPTGSGGGHWCTITTNECVARGASVTGQCAIPTFEAAATCAGGAAAAAAVTVGSLGLLGHIALIGAAGVCGASSVGASRCCQEYAKVRVWCQG